MARRRSSGTRSETRGAGSASAAAARGSGRVTLRVLADHLHLSPASISLVLNQAPAAEAIPPATQARIREAARAFDYRPNTLAKSLRRQRSFTIGVMVPEISEGYASLVMSGIEDQLLQDGYLYFVASHRHRRDLIEEYPRLLLARSVDGIIAVDTPVTQALNVPVVAVSGHGHTAGVTNIVLDHDRAALLAMRHLADLGHRRIAFIKGQPFSSDSSVRWQGIRAAARALALPIAPALTMRLEEDCPGPELGRTVARQLLATGRAFTALFAFNDMSAIGAIQALRDAGLRVPEDVSVVGFDDIQSAAYQNPGLTTVRQPLRHMGELAARTILQRVEREGASATAANRASARAQAAATAPIVVEAELIVRGTTAVAARGTRA